MSFSGAVLVDNKRIQNACDNYKVVSEERNEYVNKFIDILTQEFEGLSWWQKFCYNDDPLWGLEKFQYVLKKKYKVFYGGRYSKHNLDGLYKGLVISEEVYDKYNFGYHHDKRYDLMTMIRCGEPVYLNPSQAEFVNRFYNEEKDNG